MTKAEIDIQFRQAEIKEKEEKAKIEKLKSLLDLMAGVVPGEVSVLSESTHYKALFDEFEMKKLKDKVFDIVRIL